MPLHRFRISQSNAKLAHTLYQILSCTLSAYQLAGRAPDQLALHKANYRAITTRQVGRALSPQVDTPKVYKKEFDTGYAQVWHLID